MGTDIAATRGEEEEGEEGESRTAILRSAVGRVGLGIVKQMNRDGIMCSNANEFAIPTPDMERGRENKLEFDFLMTFEGGRKC